VGDEFLGYVPPPGVASHKLRTRRVGTDAGLPVIVEQFDEATFGVGLVSGQQEVPTSEDALPSIVGRRMWLTALLSNGEAIAVGTVGVTLLTGYLLLPGSTLELRIANLNLIHLLAANAGQRVAWLVETV
jgi:hypothetical protein